MDNANSQIDLEIKIQNIVASAALKHTINLNAIVKAFPEAEYRPKQFPGVIFKLKRPKTTFLIFGSGKMVCVGARSEKEAKIALRKIIQKFKKEGIFIVGEPEIQIKNVVASANLGGSIDLLQLYESTRSMRGKIMYEPEQFPGLIFRMESPKAVFLIYSNGKIVCVGARKEKDVYAAVSNLKEQLEERKLICHE